MVTNKLSQQNNAPNEPSVTSIWKSFLIYIQYLKLKHNNDINNIDFNSEIKKEIFELSVDLLAFSSLETQLLVYNALKYYAKNKKDFIQMCLLVLEEKKKSPESLDCHYTYNKNSFRKKVIVDLIDATSETFTPSQQKGLNTITQLSNDFFSLDSAYETKIRESCINILLTTGNYLKKFKFPEIFAEDFRNLLSPVSLGDLSYPYRQDTPDCISMGTFFTENYLKSLKLPQLLALCTFWVNKTAQKINDLSKLIFVVNELNLWDDAIKEKKYVNIDKEKARILIARVKELTAMETSVFDKVSCIADKNPDLSLDDLNVFFDEEIRKKIRVSKNRYQNAFINSDSTSDSEEILKKDLDSLHEFTNLRYLLYDLKNTFTLALLMGCIDEHYSKNWGIAEEECPRPHYIGLCIDIEGLNMPLRVHIHEEKLKSFLKNYTGDTIIPLYRGYKDMVIERSSVENNRRIVSHDSKEPLLMPLCKKQVNFTKQKLSDPSKLRPDILNYLRHLQFLINEKKLPPTLKHENSNHPNAINIETGEKLIISSKEIFKR